MGPISSMTGVSHKKREMWTEITDAQGKHHGTIQVEIEVMCLKDT